MKHGTNSLRPCPKEYDGNKNDQGGAGVVVAHAARNLFHFSQCSDMAARWLHRCEGIKRAHHFATGVLIVNRLQRVLHLHTSLIVC